MIYENHQKAFIVCSRMEIGHTAIEWHRNEKLKQYIDDCRGHNGFYEFFKPFFVLACKYSKRHNKFLLPVPAKAIYGSFCRTENEIFNVVNYNKDFGVFMAMFFTAVLV